MPDGAIYFRGFEQGSVDLLPEWSSTGDVPWERTSEEAASGVFSMRSPNLKNDAFEQRSSSITFLTNPDWGAGNVHYSIYATTQQPFDDFELFVDGTKREGGPNRVNQNGFEERLIALSPGAHEIVWTYAYNPNSLSAEGVPPESEDRFAAVFLDNVYFDPLIDPKTPSPTPDGDVSTPPSTAAPTSTPDGALSFDGFEQGSLATLPEWNSTGNQDALWERTNEQAASGVFSLRSPQLENADKTTRVSNVTFQTDSNWNGGMLHFSTFTTIQMPIDSFFWYVDGQLFGRSGNQVNLTSFEKRQIQLSPGPHVVTWSYAYNPNALEPQFLPPNQDAGAVFLDNVYFVPFNQEIPVLPTSSPSYSPTSPPIPSSDISVSPTKSPSKSPSYSPTSAGPNTEDIRNPNSTDNLPSNLLLCAPLDPNPDSFESAAFPLPPWSTGGAGNWTLSSENAFNGTTSIKSPNLDGSLVSSISNVTLDICDGFVGGSLQFDFIASVVPPHDTFIVYVDGANVLELSDVHEWTEAPELRLNAGPHRVDFSYQYNPFELSQMPTSEAQRKGAVWLDNVEIEFLPQPTKRLFHSSKRKRAWIH